MEFDMSHDEQRQHFRVEDNIHFEYCIISSSDVLNESAINEQLLGKEGLRYRELMHFYSDIDSQINELDMAISAENPTVAHYLKLLNQKLEQLARFVLLDDHKGSKKVNLSLGGMAFDCNEELIEKTLLKIRINTRPKYIPIIVDSRVVYSKFQSDGNFRVAVEFIDLNSQQELLLSRHIMFAQTQQRPD